MGSFAEFAAVLETVKSNSGKNEKVRILSEYMRNLEANDALYVARFSTGRANPKGSADETQVGYSTILDSIEELTGITPKEVSQIYLKHGDLGDLAEQALQTKKETALFSGDLSITDVADAFDKLTSSKGKGSTSIKRSHLKALLLSASPVEAKYIVKILTREMRIGLVDGLVEEAIARAYSLDASAVRAAHLLLGDIGALAYEARLGRLGEVKLQKMRPTNFMLAEPMKSPEEISDYFSREVLAEFKYDGIRAQLHKAGKDVKIFSRRLEEISASFPEVVKDALAIDHDFIVDGEIVALRDGKPLPFQMLQRRLRRIDGFDDARREIPVHCFCFDVLLLDDDEGVYREPLTQRRRRLVQVVRGNYYLSVAEATFVKTSQEIADLFRKSRTLGYEGLVVKDPESPYTPGRRGRYWMKLKEELDTIDAVIVAAEYGHGKRAGVISDYTFAVRDGSELKVIGKAYSGLTDKEIDDMTTRLKQITIQDYGYRRTVKPEIIVEVAFDSVQKSGRHDSGYALRFPRIKKLRDDKSVEDIDTLDRVAQIYESQKVKLDER